MPKIKTHKGMQKRVKKTKSGLYSFKKCGSRHLRIKKGKTPRRDRYGRIVCPAESATVKSLVPYL